MNICWYRTLGVAALAALAALALALTAPPATAQQTATLTVSPDNITRPLVGDKPMTLHFSHTGCADDCWVALDPGWDNPDTSQAVKGGNADFGAANRWATDKTINGKAGKGPVPDEFGIKVRPGNLLPAFIRFTLNDSSGVRAEAKVWLNTPGLVFNNQEPQQTQPQLNQNDEYQLLQQGPGGEEIQCWVRMTGGAPSPEGYLVEEKHTRSYRTYRGSQSGDWQTETTYTTRPLRSGEQVRLSLSSYRSSSFDFRWHLVSVVDARTGEAMSNLGLPSNFDYHAPSFNAPSKSFTINYRIQQSGQNGASNTCSATFVVR